MIPWETSLLGCEAHRTLRNYLSLPHVHNGLRKCQAEEKLPSLLLTVSDTTRSRKDPGVVPKIPRSPNALCSDITQSFSRCQEKEKERKPQEHTKSMSNSFAPWNKTHCRRTQSRVGRTKERPGHTRRGAFLSFPKQNCPLLKRSCCSDVGAGGRGAQISKQKASRGGRGGPERASEGGFFSPHTSKPLNARRPRPELAAVCYYPGNSKGPNTRECVPSR